MRRLALAFLFAFALSSACGVTAPGALAPGTSSPATTVTAGLPKPIAQPITRTSPAAQVAWLRGTERDSGAHALLIGVDPSGAIVAQIDLDAIGARRVMRSGDGSALFAFIGDRIDVYSGLDGKITRSYRGPGTGLADGAFSSDGRWAAFLLTGAQVQVQVLDLWSGASQFLPLEHDPSAKLPGLSGNIANALWGTLTFGDSSHLYTLTDWGGPARVTSFTLAGTTWSRSATTVSGEKATYPECAGPALALKVVLQGRALAAFCHVDGAVWLFDLVSPTSVAVLHPTQRNPFWLSPVFTPDGQLLYLHQSPGFGDEMQVVDLGTKRVLGPVPTPTKPGTAGPFAWAVATAYAGGVASTVPISPDGLKLYSATVAGIVVLRVPDLSVITTLAPGKGAGEVWISGDGRTVYAIDADRLRIASDNGHSLDEVHLPKPNAFFVASEHG